MAQGYYPVFLDLAGRPCVVLGGGELAAGKLPLLLDAGAAVTVVAAAACAEIERRAAAGEVRLVRRGYESGDLAGARLVIDASDDPDVNRRARAEAGAERALLNVVDRTALCDWIAPAVVDRGPLKIAISTAGESPFLAAAMRRRLERVVGPEWRAFTAMVGGLRRRLRAGGVPGPEQERVYRRALRSDVRRLLREGRAPEATALLEDVAAGGAPRVVIAGAGPGGAGLLTEDVREALAEADVVFHDALVEPDVLALCGPRTELVDVGKRAGGRRTRQPEINRLLIEAARAGREAVRLKGGDPFLFGRGGEEVAALAEAGIEVRVLPGVSSATAAPALAGIPLTIRGVAASVGVCTAQIADGPAQLQDLARAVDTLVVMMALARAPELAAELAEVLGPDRPVAMVSSAATPREHVVTATLATLPGVLAASSMRAPALMVVGEVVAAARRARDGADAAVADRSVRQ